LNGNPAADALALLVRGVLAGLGISAPVGPVNVLCISRTLAGGRRAGLIAGLGAAAADTLYGAVAAFSISIVIGFLIREQFWIRLVGGMLLIGIGIVYYLKKPGSLEEFKSESSQSGFLTAFLLNLTNPTTILSFLALLAVLGAGQNRAAWLTSILVAGIFIGGMLWWILLAVIAGRFQNRFNDRSLVWMNRIAALAIGSFGILTMILSRGHRH
jgi:threonine/homoserine/homoserine lactone efflux protein